MGLALAAYLPITAILGALMYLSARYGVWSPVGQILYTMWYASTVVVAFDILMALGLTDAVGEVARFVVSAIL